MFTTRSVHILYSLIILLVKNSLLYAETEEAIVNANEQFRHQSSAYALSITKSSWSDALNTCHHTGGRLAFPMNPEIEASIRIFLTGQNIGENENVWTSGKAWRGQWRWYLPNVPIVYENFMDAPCGVPLEGHAVYMMRSIIGAWGWCKEPEESHLRFLCEYDTAPTMPTTTTTTSSVTVPYDSSSTASPTHPTDPSEGTTGGSSRGEESVPVLISLLLFCLKWKSGTL